MQEITYPTGGKTSFEYSLNMYSKAVSRDDRTVLNNVSGTAGGLRVTKITTTDNTGVQQVKEYFYVKGYTGGSVVSNLESSGVLYLVPQYEFSNFNGYNNQNATFSISLFSSNPIIPLSQTSTGLHIGYSEVVERRSDGGFTIFKFTNHDNGYSDVNAAQKWNRSYVPYLPNSSRDFERGRLLEKYLFTSANKIAQSEVHQWDRLGSNAVRSIQQDYKGTCGESEGMAYVSRAAYYLFYYPFVVKKITTRNYESGTGNTYVEAIQNITYENKLPKTIVVTNSKAEELKTEYFYPGNVSGTVYSLMVGKHMLNYVVKEEKYLGSTLEVPILTDYSLWSNGGIYPERVKKRIGSNNPITDLQIHSYDEKGNIVSATPVSGVRESYVWGNNKTLLVAKVTNAKPEEIGYASFERNENSSWSFGGIPIADVSAPAGRKVYSLANGGIQRSGLEPNLVYIISYWSKDGSQQVNSTTGTAGRSVNGYTYFEHTVYNPSGNTILVSGAGTIDELRVFPEGAQMTTFAYEPLVGMTSQSDALNRTTYYEYDPFSRLILIRDQDRSILKKMCYLYETQMENCNIEYYYNEPQTRAFSKVCPSGYDQTPPLNYTIAANNYRSTISVAEANLQALSDINVLGQAQANATLKCYQHISTVQMETEVTGTYEDDYTYIEFLDVWIRWYGDDLYSPLYLENPLNIHFTITSTYGGVEHRYYTAPVYDSEYYLGNWEATHISPGYSNQLIFNVISYGY